MNFFLQFLRIKVMKPIADYMIENIKSIMRQLNGKAVRGSGLHI
jgi:hypothetical protein